MTNDPSATAQEHDRGRVVSTAFSDRSERGPAVFWNDDKKHRCPACHAVTVDLERPRSWRVYTCCRCGTRFTRWPRLARLLPEAGVRCSEQAAVIPS
jgi:hypothetical protein